MATIKIKFRPSLVEQKEGSLFFQILHKRIARQISTRYRLFPTEWNCRSAEIILPLFKESRRNYLLAMKKEIDSEICQIKQTINALEEKKQPYTASDVVNAYLTPNKEKTLFTFMGSVIEKLKSIGKMRLSETYTTTLNSFVRFREGEDILLIKIDSDLMMVYEAYLKNTGVCPNSSSFYLRNLRAIYNRAVEKELTPQRYPFKHVYTGIDKTVKRAISLKEIRLIKELDLTQNPIQEYTRDLFLFSFYTRGMSFIDIAFLKKKDLNHHILSYRRKKTGQQLSIRWEKCMQEIVDKYNTSASPYLLPIIKIPGKDERKQYINAAHLVNNKLKEIGKKLKLSIPLTMYCARHSWASIAKSKNVPVSVISEGMGHDSENTTQIYLASLDTSVIDDANSLILKSI
ncbi:site-specific integrase [Bacteroides sp.]|uniref:site-specific integrase n=1 Tax=Bacteroides sp. TaxID=29523 RepID=UPI00262258DC|nr:site-specific integrase [Bacteroides sp.]MDD3036780.1 site-specific integrase [Bacteroides sp.]